MDKLTLRNKEEPIKTIRELTLEKELKEARTIIKLLANWRFPEEVEIPRKMLN